MRGTIRHADARRTLSAVFVAVLAAAASGAPGDVREPRYYVATSPAACETIDYGCPRGWTGFSNAHGCGCVRTADDGAK